VLLSNLKGEKGMASEKACKKCRAIYTGPKCPKCGYEESSDSFKGKVVILKEEESEIGEKLGIKDKGDYAIKLG
jgi:DNA-directed RNA polymerase subunit E"